MPNEIDHTNTKTNSEYYELSSKHIHENTNSFKRDEQISDTKQLDEQNCVGI